MKVAGKTKTPAATTTTTTTTTAKTMAHRKTRFQQQQTRLEAQGAHTQSTWISNEAHAELKAWPRRRARPARPFCLSALTI